MMENLDRSTILMAVGVGIAVGAGSFVVMESPLGIVAGIAIAIAIVVGVTKRKQNKES